MNNFDQILSEGFLLLLKKSERQNLFRKFCEMAEISVLRGQNSFVLDIDAQKEIDDVVKRIEFSESHLSHEVMDFVFSSLERYQLNTSHPCYFGVFNPHPSTMGVIADCLVAVINPQLASSRSSKFCIAVEEHLINYFGTIFGYQRDKIDGIFTTGGTEANYTAMFSALNEKIPDFKTQGLCSLRQQPVIYCSSETHHSIARAARLVGLGSDALRVLPVDDNLQFDSQRLDHAITSDRNAGRLPLLIVATLGSTSAGIIDPLDSLAAISEKHDVWFHVDGAYGAAICMLENYSSLLQGLSRSDSIAFDAHKWLSMPMGCGLYVSRHKGSLRDAFDVEESPYMPNETRFSDSCEPYRQSMQWSRRAMGLKLFMTLMVHGEEGYRATLRHQLHMGELLKAKLREQGFRIKNNTPLPVACFVDGETNADPESMHRYVINSKKAFLTTTKLRGEIFLRAGVPNFLTQEEHIDHLLLLLNEARRHLRGG